MAGVSSIGNGLSTLGNADNAGSSLAKDLDSFLTLLVAQLQNQDPLEPMDSAEFTNQLVQYANVEQNIATNKNLENLLIMTNNNLAVQATTYLDKVVQVESVYMPVSDGYGKFSYVLGKDAVSCTITITDTSGNVASVVKGDLSAGRHVLDWDGTDTSGKQWPDGAYKITIEATDAAGNPVENYMTVFGKVTGVANDGTDVAVALGDVIVSTSKILAVHKDNELQKPPPEEEKPGDGDGDGGDVGDVGDGDGGDVGDVGGGDGTDIDTGTETKKRLK